MERNLRIAVPVAGGAVLVSLIVGLFAGVPFGTAVLRAILAGGTFGVLAFGLTVVVRTQLPGFDGSADTASASQEQSGDSDSSQQASGSRLNIVVEDEQGVEDSGESAESGGSGASESSDHADDSDDSAGGLVEEVEERSADDEEAVMSAAISEEQDGTSAEIDDTMLDEMPDIGTFAGSFVSGDDTDSEESGDAEGSGWETGGSSDGTKQKKGDPRKGFDNKTIAKALQTFMAKDDE